ncbi:MAG TPA: c-type cytochrome [Verrucomicrobia bacterium]|nr:c-type cytochrome [Verrucomicrobiota bacterium]
MNFGPLIFLGIFLSLASSWCGLILIPLFQFGKMEPVTIEMTGEIYPQPKGGEAKQGMSVYRSNGCIYCHSQQVRPRGFGADIERGWGSRRSVGRDYIYDNPVLLGTMRTGPDLTNIGQRQPSEDWHFSHLYDPQITSPGSNMPPYRFLFETRPIRNGVVSENALKLPANCAPEDGFEIVPKKEAKALVAYLLSLQATAPLPEAR